MALSKPAGRPGPPTNPGIGKEEKARSGSSYQSGAKAGFSINGGSIIDAPAVSASSPVQKGKASMPSTELGEKAVN